MKSSLGVIDANRFYEVNELYDGTCNQSHFMSFSTETDQVVSNEVFTYAQALKQHDIKDFMDSMEKKIADHTMREHWIILTHPRPLLNIFDSVRME